MKPAIVLAIIITAACGRSSRDERACERTIEAASERVAQEQRKAGVPGGGSALAAATRLTTIASCEADKWSDDVLRCIETSRLEVDLSSCYGRLTHDQWESLQKKLAALRAQLAEAPPIATTPALPPDAPEARVRALDAPVPDAPAADASVTAPEVPVTIPPLDAPPSARDAGRRDPDCDRVLLRPRDPTCRKQYCDAHPNEVRCQIE